ncbi:MAG: FKBP-type peptidyl-prolyl cis-trans isomerase [Dysgonamonadaceae bacterium]|jgi:FKBP-type peptidyl-prolyl cis-trans isomerase FklB|nr:FKBP-type peptidyl-prolyl cis-trans isomerase [Dysgonamonadaceae bacterium]
MKKLANVSLFSLLAFVAITLFSCNAQVPKAELQTDIDSVSYAQGVLFASQQVDQIFAQFELDSVYKADFMKGFQEGFCIDAKDKKTNAHVVGKMVGHQMGTQFVPYFNKELFGEDSTQTMSRKNFLSGYLESVRNPNKTIISREEARAYAMTATERIKKASLEKQYVDVKKENLDFLEKNKAGEGVVVLPSGLQYKVVKEGTGAKPLATDVVKVDYHGTTVDGKVFDSSVERGTPAEFPLNGVIAGWTEGIQLMPVGSKYIFYIPYNLAYGEQGRGENIGPFATLIFEVELYEIVKK